MNIATCLATASTSMRKHPQNPSALHHTCNMQSDYADFLLLLRTPRDFFK